MSDTTWLFWEGEPKRVGKETVRNKLLHNGVIYKPGAVFELPAEEAADLCEGLENLRTATEEEVGAHQAAAAKPPEPKQAQATEIERLKSQVSLMEQKLGELRGASEKRGPGRPKNKE